MRGLKLRHISRNIEPNPNGSNTTQKLRGGITGKGFQPGFDPKRNLKGRPRSFDQARALAQEILHRELELKDGKSITVAEAILTSWAKTKQQQKDLIELAFGKVPDKIEATGLENKTTLVLKFDHERPELAGRN